jgi:hypothetical protein
MKQLFLIILICGIAEFATAQGVINIVQDAEIESALQRHKEINQSTQKIKGWCVMISASTDRAKMMSAKAQFLRDYPYIQMDWIYENPYFKLRAGAYNTKMEAAGLLKKIKGLYPSAYITRGEFTPRELL